MLVVITRTLIAYFDDTSRANTNPIICSHKFIRTRNFHSTTIHEKVEQSGLLRKCTFH